MLWLVRIPKFRTHGSAVRDWLSLAQRVPRRRKWDDSQANELDPIGSADYQNASTARGHPRLLSRDDESSPTETNASTTY